MTRLIVARSPFTPLVLLALLLAPGIAYGRDLPGLTPLLAPVHGIGLVVPADSPAAAMPPNAAAPALPANFAKLTPGALFIALEVTWSSAAPPDLTGLAAHLDTAAAERRPAIVLIRGEGAPAGLDPAADAARRKAWLDGLRAIARAGSGRPAWYLLDGGLPEPGSPADAERALYELKAASTALRGEQPGCGIGVRIAGAEARDLLLRAYALHGDLAPYVDAVAEAVPEGADPTAAAQALRADLVPLDAGASVWIETAAPPAGADPAEELPARAAEALAGRADLALVRAPAAAGATVLPGAAALLGLARALGPGLGTAPAANAELEAAPGTPAVRWAYFYDDAGAREIVAFWAPPGAAETGSAAGGGGAPGGGGATEAALLLGTTLRRAYSVFDPTGRGVGAARTGAADGGRVRLDVSLYRRPLLLVIDRAPAGPKGALLGEQAGAEGRTSATVEEVIAAYQAWHSFQDERLQNAARDGEMTFRTRFGQINATVDITVRADYFWDRASGAEWAIRETLFNGVRLDWKKIPELPIIGRDAVLALPLELDFDRRYVYRLEDVDEVEGRRCWRVGFEPAAGAEGSLYRGRAWIDESSGALVRVNRIQLQLRPPLISDEETQTYRPFDGPDGTSYWLLDAIDGQQIYTVSGQNLVVLRRTRFGPPRINGPGFAAARAGAYASERQMLRDTTDGMKWLSRQPDGSRKLLDKGDPTQLFAVAGAFTDEGVDGVLPLAGINYTNIDTFGKGAIFNLFFAGLLANVTLNQPGLFGTRAEAGLTLNAVGYSSSDKVYSGGVELEDQRVKNREQMLRANVGVPIGQFVKLRLSGELNYENFQRDDTTAPDFVLPVDHVERFGEVGLAFDRRGWGFAASYSVTSRDEWEPWGPAGELAGAEEIDATRSYSGYELSGVKNFFLPLFQEVNVALTYRAGEDLDRFSAFDLGSFGGLRGFGGSGIRYDRGLIAELGYAFNLGEVLRFDAEIEHGRVHDAALSPDLTDHTGIGLAASFVGPWETIVRLDGGYALRSDLAEAEGGTAYTFVVLKLF